MSTEAKRRATKRLPPEALTALLGLAPGLPGSWHTSAANIAMEAVAVRAADVDWLVHVHAYAVRMHPTSPRALEVTVGATIQTSGLPKGRPGRARAAEWQRAIAERFSGLGYEGVWGESPDGPFAHFSKRVKGVRAVPAAVRQLQRIRF